MPRQELTLQELILYHVAPLKILFYASSSRHYECYTNTSFYAVQIQMPASESARPHTLPTKKVYISTMVGIMELSSPRLLLGLPLDAESGAELLSWAISVAAHPNDTITALHVLVNKAGQNYVSVTKMRQAKSFIISMLGEFAEICQSKQVNLEAKVVQSSGVGKGLIEEAALLRPNILIIGGCTIQSKRSSLETTKYCFDHAPEGCLVIAMRRKQHPPSSRLIPIQSKRQELHSSEIKRVSSCRSDTLAERLNAKLSPIAVLDGPEGVKYRGEDDCCSRYDDHVSSGSCLSPPNSIKRRNGFSFKSRSKRWKNLAGLKLKFPFFNSPWGTGNKLQKQNSFNGENQQPSWRCFSYEEVVQATNNFHSDNMVGKGGYSEVYKGYLLDGQVVAVKRLAKDNADEAKEKVFLNELGVIGHVNHPNTSHLIGCCVESGLHLIFNFSSKGSLASTLHGKNGEFLPWSVRYKIAIGVAKGLHYLHKCCKHRIIHRDIKASNILLGFDYEPQVSDFGLAKWLPKQWTHHSVIPIEGTFGYLAPEYFMHGVVDEKTDVYAFGVLLLEIITGRRPIDIAKQSLLIWVKPHIESGNVVELADPCLDGNYDMVELKRLVMVAAFCVRQSPAWRPTMSEVLELMIDECDSGLARSRFMSEHEDEELEDWTSEINSQILTSSDCGDDN